MQIPDISWGDKMNENFLMAKEQSDGLLYPKLILFYCYSLSLPSCLFKLKLFLTYYDQCLAVIITTLLYLC